MILWVICDALGPLFPCSGDPHPPAEGGGRREREGRPWSRPHHREGAGRKESGKKNSAGGSFAVSKVMRYLKVTFVMK